MKVYVAGPITIGDQIQNCRNAIEAGDKLLLRGHTPFVPHVTLLWHFAFPHSWETWMKWDSEWLKVCDAVLRIPGESTGADREVEMALELSIPVYYNIDDIHKAS